MATKRPLAYYSGVAKALQSGDSLPGGVSPGLVGVLNIPSGTAIGGVAATDVVIDWLFTGIKASDGTVMTPQGGKLPIAAATLFTASADFYVRLLMLGNPTASDVTGVFLTIASKVIPGPSVIPAGCSLVLTEAGWIPRNSNGGAF